MKKTYSAVGQDVPPPFPLREACMRHFATTLLEHVPVLPSFLIQWAQERWSTLFTENAWLPIENSAADLHRAAVRNGKVESKQLVEAGPTGRMVLVSVASSIGDDNLMAWLEGRDYSDFMLDYRRQFK